jgi:microcin C transport system permease protein
MIGMHFSPITQRRLDIFKSHKRGYYSLWLLSILFIVSCFAELIANENPIVVRYDSQWYFPVVQDIPETTFGGAFPTETQYQDPAVKQLIEAKGWMLNPILPYSANSFNYANPLPAPSAPSADNWLGTDDLGRDVFTRLLYGMRISLVFGLILTFFSAIIGIWAGAIQGFYGGKVDLLGQRFIEIWSSMPQLMLLIILSSIIAPNFFWILLILLLFSWLGLEPLIRAEFLKARNLDYVRAAKALGQSDFKIMFKHILPNAMVATVTYMPFILAGGITSLTALDFLGFGLPADQASLGDLMSQGKTNIEAPWLGLSAFFTLTLILTLLIFIGEAVRDAFDPRKQLNL